MRKEGLSYNGKLPKESMEILKLSTKKKKKKVKCYHIVVLATIEAFGPQGATWRVVSYSLLSHGAWQRVNTQ